MTNFQAHGYAMDRARELGNPYTYLPKSGEAVLIDPQNKLKLLGILSSVREKWVSNYSCACPLCK